MINTFSIPVIPQNDEDRLRALDYYQVLDTPPEQAFTNLARIIAEVFEMPIALISLVDRERVFFKANVGMPGVTSTSRGISLCALAVLDDQPTVFEDALESPCLIANPLVQGDFGLRFYAGAPLTTPDGYHIGTVCVVDKKPREFSEANRQLLQRFASAVMHDIETRLIARQKSDELEQQVEARSSELKAANLDLLKANQELERFAFVASHDLQEPLRKLLMFTDLLFTETGQNFRGQSLFYWERIRHSTQRMQQLIRDVLAISKIGKSPETTSVIDLTAIANEACQDLELVIQDVNARIMIGPLPHIRAVSHQIRQLFFNLIGNAIKFSKPGTNPQVDITGESLSARQISDYKLPPDVAYVRLVIADEGIGFDEQFRERIFTIFQRLHDRTVYEGNGIGLAICKRIVENHDGLIWAESEPEKGARFTLVLPN